MSVDGMVVCKHCNAVFPKLEWVGGVPVEGWSALRAHMRKSHPEQWKEIQRKKKHAARTAM